MMVNKKEAGSFSGLNSIVYFAVIILSSAYNLHFYYRYHVSLVVMAIIMGILLLYFRVAITKSLYLNAKDARFIMFWFLLFAANLLAISLFSREPVNAMMGVGTMAFLIATTFYVMALLRTEYSIEKAVRMNIFVVFATALVGIVIYTIFLTTGNLIDLNFLREVLPMDPLLGLYTLMFAHYGDMETSMIPRICGLFGDANMYALFLSLMLPFIIVNIIYCKKLNKRIPFSMLIVLLTVFSAFILTFSRSAYFGLLTSSFLLLGILAFKPRARKYVIRAIIPVMIGMFIIFIFSYIREMFVLRLTRADASFFDHFQMGGESLAILAGHIVGIGWNNFTDYLNDMRNSSFMFNQSHSMYLTLLVETGAQGFIIFISLMFYLIRRLWNIMGEATLDNIGGLNAAAALLGVFNILATNIFYSMFIQPYIWLFIGLCFAIVNAYSKGKIKNGKV